METYILQYEKGQILIKIIKSRRKSVSIELKESKFVLRAPIGISDAEISDIVNRHKRFIINNFEKAKMREKNRLERKKIPDINELSAEEIIAIKEKFQSKVKYYAEIMDITYGNITIRNQKTRWGSCSSKGNLNFNYKLFFLPEELMDYVIIHELSHRAFMNHGKEFWKMVESFCPDYMECRKKLREM